MRFRDPLVSNIIQQPLTGEGFYWVLPLKKFENYKLFFFCSQIKSCLHVSGLEITKCLSAYQTGKPLLRLLLQKQSDLGLHLQCLSVPIWQATRVFLEHLQYPFGLNFHLFPTECLYCKCSDIASKMASCSCTC